MSSTYFSSLAGWSLALVKFNLDWNVWTRKTYLNFSYFPVCGQGFANLQHDFCSVPSISFMSTVVKSPDNLTMKPSIFTKNSHYAGLYSCYTGGSVCNTQTLLVPAMWCVRIRPWHSGTLVTQGKWWFHMLVAFTELIFIEIEWIFNTHVWFYQEPWPVSTLGPSA